MTKLENLLEAIATAVMEHFHGRGKWLSNRDGEYKKPQEYLEGLSFGDRVYFYDEDEEAIAERIVAHVWDGVAFYIVDSHYWGPTLVPVVSDFYLSRDAALIGEAGLIQESQAYNDDRFKRSAAMMEELSKIIENQKAYVMG